MIPRLPLPAYENTVAEKKPRRVAGKNNACVLETSASGAHAGSYHLRGPAMFIFWGTKRVVKKPGYTADFCPICRDLQRFQIERAGMAGHLYGISLVEGKLIGHRKICLACKTATQTVLSLYKEVQRGLRNLTVAELIANTFPNIREHHANRLALEEHVRRNPGEIDPSVRIALIKESLYILSAEAENRPSDSLSNLIQVLEFIGCLFLGPFLAFKFAELLPDQYAGIAAGIAFVAGLAYVIFRSATATTRMLRSKIYPKLVLALKPIKPTQGELDSALAELRKEEMLIAKKLKENDLQMLVAATGAG